MRLGGACGDGNRAGQVAMSARILLITLLVYGWTGLAICKAACAEAAGLRPGVHAPTTEAASPGNAACHGHGAPYPGPTPERSSNADDSPCCCALDLAMSGETLGVAHSAAGVPAVVSDGVREIRASRAIAFTLYPPRRLNSPFESQNPPLLS